MDTEKTAVNEINCFQHKQQQQQQHKRPRTKESRVVVTILHKRNQEHIIMSPHSSTADAQLPLSLKIASAGMAGCTADLMTFPLDTVKVWLMVRGEEAKPVAANPSSSLPTKFAPVESARESSTGIYKRQAVALSQKLDKPGLKKFFRPTTMTTSLQKKTTAIRFSAYNAKLSKIVPSPIKPYGAARTNFGVAAVAQSQSTASRSSAGLVRTVINGVKQNGFLSLYGGFAAGLQRQVSFCAVRIGLYDSVKGFYMQLIPTSTNSKQVPQRILAGATTAIMAATMFQPTEVVKIRMQAQTRLPASQRTYTSSVQAYRSIFRHGGIPELWKGLGANATRLSVVNVSELVTYDLVKEFILDHKILNDNPICHFTSAFISGFVTTLVASPVDVVKTRYMNSPLGTYKNPIHCTKTLFMQEGMKAFYKG
nr:mitochondrial uncoupling protein 3 isoform X2 [Ciona intestinalis]|eukprot:XP_018669017.1 mitochondrial uncoupling protein 3 isoform X2 [Ciona intestinalis]